MPLFAKQDRYRPGQLLVSAYLCLFDQNHVAVLLGRVRSDASQGYGLPLEPLWEMRVDLWGRRYIYDYRQFENFGADDAVEIRLADILGGVRGKLDVEDAYAAHAYLKACAKIVYPTKRRALVSTLAQYA